MKTGCNLVESSDGGYGSKKGCFASDNDVDDESSQNIFLIKPDGLYLRNSDIWCRVL